MGNRRNVNWTALRVLRAHISWGLSVRGRTPRAERWTPTPTSPTTSLWTFSLDKPLGRRRTWPVTKPHPRSLVPCRSPFATRDWVGSKGLALVSTQRFVATTVIGLDRTRTGRRTTGVMRGQSHPQAIARRHTTPQGSTPSCGSGSLPGPARDELVAQDPCHVLDVQ